MRTILYLLCAGTLFALVPAESSAQQPTFKLPFAPSSEGHLCTQGVFGTTSHDQGNLLTQYDLDFDTPNSGAAQAQDVLAAADGFAYGFGGCVLFDETCNHGFGNHVKIDHGNGIFTIYAHLETIRVSTTGASVVKQGNVIGKEGATGQAINPTDWSIMNSKWLTNDARADINQDGIVNSLDFSIMNGNWLQ